MNGMKWVWVSLPHKKKIGAVERIERSGHLGLVFDRLHDARDAVVDELREDRRSENQPEAYNRDDAPDLCQHCPGTALTHRTPHEVRRR